MPRIVIAWFSPVNHFPGLSPSGAATPNTRSTNVLFWYSSAWGASETVSVSLASSNSLVGVLVTRSPEPR